jgi:DNA-directed RNA polymerase specialized sigma24 family protein
LGMESRSLDRELVRASVADPAVFSLLHERHLRAVAGYVVRKVGAEAVEDVAAEVFVRAFRARHGYVPQHESLLPWLLGIANNVISEHRKLERRRLAALERLVRTAPSAGPPKVG